MGTYYDITVDRFCFNFKHALANLIEEVKVTPRPRKQNLFKTEMKTLSKIMKNKNKSSVLMTTDKHLGVSNTPKDQFLLKQRHI